MFKFNLIALIAGALLALSATTRANQPETQPQVEAPAENQAQTQAAIPNIFDPVSWFNGIAGNTAPAGAVVKFNAANPASWMKFVDPAQHHGMHMAFTNPATYAQFMQPQFYMEFMKPENMAAWMDFNQYGVMMSPQTMNYWMNPASMMHAFDPNMYGAAMNPANYMAYMNPATYMGWSGAQTCDQDNPEGNQGFFGYAC